MILRLNLISRRCRGSITHKWYPEHRSGQLHKYVNDRQREVKGPVWSNHVSWPNDHVNWWRQMEHSRQYEEATELNMDEYKKTRGHKKRMKEVVKMGNELNGGLGLKSGVLSAEMLTTDTSERQVLVIRTDKYCPSNVKRLKWVFKKYKPLVFQTLIGKPSEKNCCECFVVFRHMGDMSEVTQYYKWKDHPDIKKMNVRQSYLWRHGCKHLWAELDTLIKARWENRAIFIVDKNLTEQQAQALGGEGLHMTYLHPNMIQLTRPTNQMDIEVDENDRTVPIKSQGFEVADSANFNRWYFNISNQIEPDGMIDGCLDNFFLTSYLPHPITGHPGLDINPGEIKSLILPGNEFDEATGKKLCSIVFVFKTKELYERVRTPMEEGQGPVRDAIYHHLELYNGINQPVPKCPEDPKTTKYFMKWMKKFNEHVDTARRPDGTIDYAASSTKRHQRGTAQLSDMEVFNDSVEYWWRQHLLWNINKHYKPGCAKYACYSLAKFMFESFPLIAYVTIAPRADVDPLPEVWSPHDQRNEEYKERQKNAAIYAEHADELWSTVLSSFVNTDKFRILTNNEFEVNFASGLDFKSADQLVSRESLANVVANSVKLGMWDAEVRKACAAHLEYYEMLMIDRHLLLRDEHFAADYNAKYAKLRAAEEQEAAIDEAMSEWSKASEAELSIYRTKESADMLRADKKMKKKRGNKKNKK